jgi:hypothetical protein
MDVASAEGQGMLQQKGCNPHVIGGDRRSLPAQLAVDASIMVRGLFVGVQDVNLWLKEKTPEDGFVLRRFAAQGESARTMNGSQTSSADSTSSRTSGLSRERSV